MHYKSMIIGIPTEIKGQQQPALIGGINLMNGKVTCKEVAVAHEMDCHEITF